MVAEAMQKTQTFLVIFSEHNQLFHCSPIPPTFGSAPSGLRQADRSPAPLHLTLHYFL